MHGDAVDMGEMSNESSSPAPWSTPTDAGARADLESLSAASAREVRRLRDEIIAITPKGAFSFLTPRFWAQRILDRRLKHAIDKLETLDQRLGSSLRDTDYLPRPTGFPPGTYPRAGDHPVTVLIDGHQEFESLRCCLVAAVRFTPAKHRILLLGTASEDGRLIRFITEICERYPNVRRLNSGTHKSLIERINDGVQIAVGDAVFVRDRNHIFSGWVNTFRDLAFRAKDIAMVFAEGGKPEGAQSYYLRRDAITALGYLDKSQGFTVPEALEDFADRAMKGGWEVLRDVSALATRLGGEAGQSHQADSSMPTLMLVVFAGGGGTPKTNLDLARGLVGKWRVLVLTISPDKWTLVEVTEGETRVIEHVFFDALTGIGDALPASHSAKLRAWIANQRVQIVHFRHWLGTAPEIVQTAKEAGAKVIVSLHDFYSVCPALNLLDASGACCFGNCESNSASITSDCSTIESWPGQSIGVTLWRNYVHTWRTRVKDAFAHADAFVTTAHSTREIIGRTQPEIAERLRIIEHGRDFIGSGLKDLARLSPARFVFLGEATFVKGADFVVELAKLAQEKGLAWEFHFVGKTFVEVPQAPNIIAHGAYERDALASTLEKIQPTLILLTSRFPETYCHTLTEAWANGLPVLAQKIGALQERIEAHGGGWLVDGFDAQNWISRLSQIIDSPEEWQRRVEEAKACHFRSVESMTKDYLDLYETVIGRRMTVD